MNQVQYPGSTNVKHYRVKICRPCDQAPEICASLF